MPVSRPWSWPSCWVHTHAHTHTLLLHTRTHTHLGPSTTTSPAAPLSIDTPTNHLARPIIDPGAGQPIGERGGRSITWLRGQVSRLIVQLPRSILTHTHTHNVISQADCTGYPNSICNRWCNNSIAVTGVSSYCCWVPFRCVVDMV